jgi:hypothetical protein
MALDAAYAAALVLAVATAPQAVAAAASSNDDAADIMNVQTLDEVVVTGRLDSLSGLQAAIVEAENRFYERWNELNDDDRLDVQCRVEAPTGTRLTRRRCEPRMVDDKTREAALAVVGVSEGAAHFNSTDAIRLDTAVELRKRTLVLLEHDAPLRRALLERARLQQLYDERRRERMAGRLVVWD